MTGEYFTSPDYLPIRSLAANSKNGVVQAGEATELRASKFLQYKKHGLTMVPSSKIPKEKENTTFLHVLMVTLWGTVAWPGGLARPWARLSVHRHAGHLAGAAPRVQSPGYFSFKESYMGHKTINQFL